MQDREYVDAQPPITIMRMTPDWADTFTSGPATARGHRPYPHRRRHVVPPSSGELLRDRCVRRALGLYNREIADAGKGPDPDDVVSRVWPPRLATGRAMDEVMDTTHACVCNYAAYLTSHGLRVRAAEVRVAIPPRRLASTPQITVAFSGIIDVVLVAEGATLMALTYAMDSTLPIRRDFAALPSTVIRHMLLRYLDPHAEGYQVGRLLPRTSASVCVQPGVAQIEAGRALIQAMAIALVNGEDLGTNVAAASEAGVSDLVTPHADDSHPHMQGSPEASLGG